MGNSWAIFFPLAAFLYLPQKMKSRTRVEPGAKESFIKDLWGVCSQLDRGKLKHLACYSQPGLHKCQGPDSSFARRRCWASGLCRAGSASCQDVISLPVVHRRSLQSFPYLRQSDACKTFFVCFNEMKLPWPWVDLASVHIGENTAV